MSTFVDAVFATAGAELECLLREVERRVHAEGWDRPNTYRLLLHNPLGLVVVGPVASGVRSFTTAHPAQALAALTRACVSGSLSVSTDFAGVVITGEAWQIQTSADDDAAVAVAHADAAARRIYTRRPDRQEIRWAMVVLADGREGRLTRVRAARDGDEDEITYQGAVVDHGTVVESLRRFVAACREQTKGARP